MIHPAALASLRPHFKTCRGYGSAGQGWGSDRHRFCGTLAIVIPAANRLPRLYCDGMARAPVACSLHSGVTNLDYALPFPRSFDRHALDVLPLLFAGLRKRGKPRLPAALYMKGLCASAYLRVNAFIVCEECCRNGNTCQGKYFRYGIYLKKVCQM
jgi:hypothetical protein